MNDSERPSLSTTTSFHDSFDDGLVDSLDAQLIDAFGSTTNAENKPRIGQKIDARFVLEGELGQGGMGWVFSARHLATNGQVAVKVMNPRLGPQGKARFAMEARNAASLTHPNTVRVFDYGQDGEQPFLVMEFLRGEPLNKVLQSQGSLSLKRTVTIASQILKALWEAHEHEIVHRDIKPGNIFLIQQQGSESFVKVLDFGISHNLNASGEPSEEIIGSPYNMAPEQWEGADVSPQTDLYAVGCLVYEMLSGQTPFAADSMSALRTQHLQEDPRFDIPQLNDAGACLHPWIRWMMAKAPKARPQSAKRALEALQDAAQIDLSISQRPAAPSGPTDTATPPGEHGTAPTWNVKLSVPALPQSDAPGRQETRHNLQLKRPWPFVGRNHELDTLSSLILQEHNNLVTVVGMGGVGKTSIIRHFARQHVHHWPGEIWFCDLSSVTTRDELWQTVAQTMGIRLTEQDQEEYFVNTLKTRNQPLLLLDNFEQITHLAPETVATWASEAPQTTFLISSREPLALVGEQTVRLSPFPLPSVEDDLETARQNDAIALFVERARRARPDFALTADNLADVVALVHQLDGLALALELAAARVTVLSPANIVSRLEHRFKLLRSRKQDAAPHQSTLKSTLDWSWDLLEPWEQEGLVQCSVFQGSFTLEAAEAVLDLSAWPNALWTTDLLQNLLDKSWLTTAQEGNDDERRFTFYVTIREYALHQRKERAQTLSHKASSDHALTRRHAEYYCSLPFDYAPWERNHNHNNLAVKEHKNFLAITRGPHRDFAYKATLAATCYYHHFGPYNAALKLLKPWLEEPPQDPHKHLRILLAYLYLNWAAGNSNKALSAKVLALAQDLKEPLMEGWTWLYIALDKHMDPETSEIPCPETFKALAIGQETQNDLLQGWAQRNIGIQYRKKGENQKAIACYRKTLVHARQHPSIFLECMTHRSLGVCLKLQGDLDEAADHYIRALDLATQLNRTITRAWILRNLSALYEILGDHNQAFKLLHRARDLARKMGHKTLEGWSCLTLGIFSANQGQRATAIDAFALGLEIAGPLNATQLRGEILGEWALIDVHMDDLEAAQRRMEESITLVEKSQDQYGLAMVLSNQVRLQLALKQPEAAAQTFSRVESISQHITADPLSLLGRRLRQLGQIIQKDHALQS